VSAVISPTLVPGTYVKARGLASGVPMLPDKFDDRVTVLYLRPDEHFAFFSIDEAMSAPLQRVSGLGGKSGWCCMV